MASMASGWDYRIGLLKVLIKLGGRAYYRDALKLLEEKLREKLESNDYGKLRNGRLRWENKAHFAKVQLKKKGFIKNGPAQGIWEITPLGRDLASGIPDESVFLNNSVCYLSVILDFITEGVKGLECSSFLPR